MSVKVQQTAPNFKGTAVVDGDFKDVSLSDYKGKFLLLFFYPLDFTFVCPTEIIAFSERAQEFKDIGCEIVAASVDSHFSHLAWINQPRKEGGLGGINFPILSDITKKVATDYGVLLPEDGVALRGLFIIDPEQKVRAITIHDLPIGRSVDEALRVVKAIQFTDKYGEVCPANWQEGSRTIDTKDSKKYFSESS
ncbi:Peroxiredoxin-2 [Tieghemiomyces parasiticus]|uniref:thioredoxin-dependent peroxiredoxin n=1 Tax=Tieghemiomyces parasiticus TaxID=78921 RepID=A0A9W7ZM23_9FUNG|nr:Peroxiredoxin-2 [Tieghemiomyces parasiticus]